MIERAVGSLQAFAAAPGRSAAEGEAYLRFFRLYAGRFHHAREEDSLFPALVRDTGAPGDRGPLKVLLEAHHAMAHLLDLMNPLLSRGGDIRDLAARYGKALLHHIDAENSVLFPEAEIGLRRAGVLELSDRPPDNEEAAAREDLEDLLAKYPPLEIPDLIRGEGCVPCEAYGEGCDGIEREWWTEMEWEDVHHRIG